MEIADEKLKELLCLVMDNDNTSSSASGLHHRAANRKQMREILMASLIITDSEAEDFYTDWREARERI